MKQQWHFALAHVQPVFIHTLRELRTCAYYLVAFRPTPASLGFALGFALGVPQRVGCRHHCTAKKRSAIAANHMWRKSVLIINLVPIRAMLSFVDPQGAQRASYLADSARCRHSLALRLSSKDIIQKIRTSSSNEIRVIHSLRSVPTSGSRVAFYGL